MKTVFAVQCNFTDAASTTAEAAWATISAWLGSTHPDAEVADAMLGSRSGELRLHDTEMVQWGVVESAGASVRRLEHVIPPTPASPAGWLTRIWVCCSDDRTWSVVRAGPGSPVGVVTSNNFEARRPRVVGDWINGLHVGRDGLRIGDGALNWGLGDRDVLLRLLLDPERTLPVVAVSKALVDGRTEVLLDVRQLARDLAGNAHTVVLDRALSWNVTETLGQPLSAFNGAARIWWPGVSIGDDPARHPLLMPDRIDANPDRARLQLTRRVWSAAVDAIPPPLLERQLITARDKHATDERIASFKTANSQDVDAVLSEWQRELDEGRRLQEVIAELEAQVDELSDALRSARAETDTAREDELPEVESVEEAVRLAASESTNVVYLPTAFEAARASQYPDPQQVLLDLRALNRVAARWEAGTLRGDFRVGFSEEPVRFMTGISQTAETKYRSDYEIRIGDEKVLMGPHLRRGTGSPAEILRVYWYVDDATKQIFVGHVGRKLRDQSNP